ncbi:MAG: hypothetical protein PHD36_05370 [Desulfotomaculaceae bacterium]|nr:hypothetical protein [Desulfotomaculaceae bacterium]
MHTDIGADGDCYEIYENIEEMSREENHKGEPVHSLEFLAEIAEALGEEYIELDV